MNHHLAPHARPGASPGPLKWTVLSVNGHEYRIGPYADLVEADLRYANLPDADLRWSKLNDACLIGTDLRNADLTGADLRGANLLHADLCWANLTDARLDGACLRAADLSEANLSRADFFAADLTNAALRGCTDIHPVVRARLSILPEGDIIGWKLCRGKNDENCRVLVRLLIPAGAKRSNSTGRKCRAEYAQVLEVIGADYAVSNYDPSFEYHPGEIVRPAGEFDDDWTAECSSGIHFYITREEAENQ